MDTLAAPPAGLPATVVVQAASVRWRPLPRRFLHQRRDVEMTPTQQSNFAAAQAQVSAIAAQVATAQAQLATEQKELTGLATGTPNQ